MPPKLILPKNIVSLAIDALVFFLAGPIRGGGDWQKRATLLLAERVPEAYIVSPCRYDQSHELCRFSLPPGMSDEELKRFGMSQFPNQTLWERWYLRRASQNGCIIFFLPEEDKKTPRPLESGPYARDTYGELGEWRARIAKDPYRTRVVIGAEPNFPGLKVIKTNCRVMLGDNYPIYGTLEETIEAAILKSQH